MCSKFWIFVLSASLLILTACSLNEPNSEPQADRAPLTSSDYASGMSQCLSTRGWRAWADGETVEASYPTSDEEMFERDYSECEDEIGANGLPLLTTEQHETLYSDYQVTTQCLMENNWTADEPVDRDAFFSAPPGQYYAYQILRPDLLPSLAIIEDACPQPTFKK